MLGVANDHWPGRSCAVECFAQRISRCAAHTVKLGHASLSQRLYRRYTGRVESWANRLHAARIGSYSGWPPLCGVRTASPTSCTVVVQGGLSLLANCNGRLSSDIPKPYTDARDTTFARIARNT